MLMTDSDQLDWLEAQPEVRISRIVDRMASCVRIGNRSWSANTLRQAINAAMRADATAERIGEAGRDNPARSPSHP